MSLDQSLAQFFGDAYVLLTNARDPDILSHLSRYGFDATRLDHGLALYQTAYNHHIDQISKYAAQYEATQTLHTARQHAHQTFSDHRALAKLLFPPRTDEYTALGLDKQRQLSFFPWLAQATSFYHQILHNPAALTAFADTFHQTRPDLEAASNAITTVADLKAAQQRAMAAAQRATQQRKIAVRELQTFLQHLKVVAKRALRGQQSLEALTLGPIP